MLVRKSDRLHMVPELDVKTVQDLCFFAVERCESLVKVKGPRLIVRPKAHCIYKSMS